MSAPERIWAYLYTGNRAKGGFETTSISWGTEFVRADIAASQLAEANERYAREASAKMILQEQLAEEFSRLIIEFNEGERQNRSEAWNLIADFAMEHSDTILRALRSLPASEAGWREITDEDRPPNDEEVLMGCWENWPSQKWMVEYGLYGSTKGGWIHGRMTHWLPSSFLPSAPDRRAGE